MKKILNGEKWKENLKIKRYRIQQSIFDTTAFKQEVDLLLSLIVGKKVTYLTLP